MLLRQITDPWLAQNAYLVGCQKTGEALLIDPERDIDRYRQIAAENGLRITAVAETHIHADFVSGAREFAQDPAIDLYLSAEGGPDWLYRWPGDRPRTHFLKHGDRFPIGRIEVEAVHAPGHTPEHLCFLLTDRGSSAHEPIALITGDFVFAGDVGRPDLLESAAGVAGAMEPAARQLRESLAASLAGFGDYLQLLPGHGAGSACGKSLGAIPTTTLGYERRFNRALRAAIGDAEDFVREILTGQPEPPLYFARMKRLNRDGAPVTGGLPEAPHVDANAFSKLAETATVVDARMDRIAFDEAHFPGALHAPLRSPLFSAGVGSFLDESDSILLILESGDDLDLARRQLYRIGHDRIAGWISAGGTAGLPAARIERIDFGQLERNPARDAFVLDVRSSAEFHADHLEGAINIPYTRLRSRLGELPRGRRLLVHCGAGRRSAVAASFLDSKEFDVVHVNGGRPAWR